MLLSNTELKSFQTVRKEAFFQLLGVKEGKPFLQPMQEI